MTELHIPMNEFTGESCVANLLPQPEGFHGSTVWRCQVPIENIDWYLLLTAQVYTMWVTHGRQARRFHQRNNLFDGRDTTLGK